MSGSHLSITLPSFAFVANSSRRSKVIVVGVALGVTILGLVARYLRRQRQSQTWHGIRARQAGRAARKGKSSSNIKSIAGDIRRRSSSPVSVSNRYHRQKSNSGSSIGGASSCSNYESNQIHLCRLGMEGLEHAITNWEDALSVGIPQLGTGTFALPAVGESEFTHQLERFIEKALELQDECEMMFNDHRTVLPSGDDLGTIHEMSKVMLIGEREVIGESGEETSTSDFEDFVSATEEIANIEELLADLPETWRLYQSGLKQVQYGYVPCRTLRTEMLRCSSDADFLAKLVCVRKAFAYILTDARMRCWFADTGREIITNLLAQGDKDPKDFIVAYNEMLLYVKDGENWDDIMEELEGRGVQEMSFVDIALDFILLDAFEDLENPPSSVIAVMQNRWLSNGFKEMALLTAVWSVLKAKRRRLKQPNGFIAHFYHISEHVSPVLAWGFLGPRSRLKELCELFKDQVLGFMQDMFSLRKCQYTTVEQLADDIIVLARHHCEHVLEKLAVSPLTDTSRENSKFPH